MLKPGNGITGAWVTAAATGPILLQVCHPGRRRFRKFCFAMHGWKLRRSTDPSGTRWGSWPLMGDSRPVRTASIIFLSFRVAGWKEWDRSSAGRYPTSPGRSALSSATLTSAPSPSSAGMCSRCFPSTCANGGIGTNLLAGSIFRSCDGLPRDGHRATFKIETDLNGVALERHARGVARFPRAQRLSDAHNALATMRPLYAAAGFEERLLPVSESKPVETPVQIDLGSDLGNIAHSCRRRAPRRTIWTIPLRPLTPC